MSNQDTNLWKLFITVFYSDICLLLLPHIGNDSAEIIWSA